MKQWVIRRAWLTRTLISIGCVAIVSLASALTVAETPRYLVGFVQDTLDNDWRVAQVDAVRTVLAEHPEIEFVVTDGGGDTAIQIQQIEEMAALGVDVLITSPREQALLTDVIADLYRQGIPVVLLDRGVQGERYTTYIHADNTRIAEDAAKHLVALLRGEGRILMLQGVPGATPTIHRTRHFLKIMSRYPMIEVKGVVANFLRSESILAVERLLQRGERFDAIYAQSDSMATGARLALRRFGIDPASIPIIGIDYIEEARAAIRSGEQSVSYTYPTGGKEGAQAVLDLLAGRPVVKEQIIRSVKVTADNVERVEPIF